MSLKSKMAKQKWKNVEPTPTNAIMYPQLLFFRTFYWWLSNKKTNKTRIKHKIHVYPTVGGC